MKHIVLGTAGHIDHGKTSLVKALTNIDTDRLKEEKARGITIELGFAYLDLPDGQRLGIVDVPGHEKFIKNMVAGVSGIDLVALVIAADEGIMPQTREHLDICSLLGIEHGLVVLTKTDLVDEEWLDFVQEDIRQYLQGTFLAAAPMVGVSAQTGRGLPQLLDVLSRLALALPERPPRGPFRLPVDRVFTIKGFGTVVTGTAQGGQVQLGQELVIYPSQISAKVRGIEVHGQEQTSTRQGNRTAINLQGVEKAIINRGDVLAPKDSLAPSMWLDLEIRALPQMSRPIKHRAPVRLHTGTEEALGRVILLDRDELAPGDSAFAQIRLDKPLAAMAGDRYVLRSYSPVATIAGGLILHPHPGRRKRRQARVMADLATLLSGTLSQKIMVHALEAGACGLSAADLMRLTNAPEKELDKTLQEMLGSQQLIRFDKETGRLLAKPVLKELFAQAQALLADYHAKNPLKPGMSREELRRRLLNQDNARLYNYTINKMIEAGLLKANKDILHLADFGVKLQENDQNLVDGILGAFLRGGFAPPALKELNLGPEKQLQPIVAMLVKQGHLLKIKEDLYYHQKNLEEIKARLVSYLQQHEKIEAQQFKELTGLSRKYLIPLLEYFDASQLTIRVGDARVLRRRI